MHTERDPRNAPCKRRIDGRQHGWETDMVSMMECPHCGEEILSSAAKCKHCFADLAPEDSRGQRRTIIGLLLFLVALVAFGALFLALDYAVMGAQGLSLVFHG